MSSFSLLSVFCIIIATAPLLRYTRHLQAQRFYSTLTLYPSSVGHYHILKELLHKHTHTHTEREELRRSDTLYGIYDLELTY